MPLPLPELDDRTFDDLVSELRSLIPRYDKTWTNHNVSDPGITLIELFSWLGEMAIYRMNRVEDRTYRTFLDLMGVQPAGAQAMITFQIRIPEAGLPATFVIPRGTRLAARDEQSGEEIVFETMADIPFDPEAWDADRMFWELKGAAVNTLEISEEVLGVSDESRGQEFGIREGPLFLDRDHEFYSGNPEVHVQGVKWEYKSDLLASGPGDAHFTADALTGLIRFGDGVSGSIPAAGSKIVCEYRRLGGKKGNVAAGKIKTFLGVPPDAPAGALPPDLISALTVFNEYPASGGVDDESLEDLLARGLGALQETYRAVSDEDFEILARQAAPDKVARVKVLADRNLEGTAPQEEAHVSLIVLPDRAYMELPEGPARVDESTGVVTSHRGCVAMAAALADPKIRRLNRLILKFLDERRLITTIVHVVKPDFTPLRLDVEIQPKPGVRSIDLTKLVVESVASFLDPYGGWEDGHGWPFGRDVYRSELYQRLESVAGVDHVPRMSMNGSAATSTVAVLENSLVCLDELIVRVL